MATSESEKPWKAEYAKSARATCATCKSYIGKEILRLGRLIRARDHDGLRPVWHHATCVMRKANKIKSIDEIEGIGSLRWEDQQKIRKYVDGTGLVSDTIATTPAPAAYCIEASQTSHAKCKRCSQKIMEGEVRIGARSLRWYHAICFLESFPSTLLDSLSGWKSLSSAHQASVRAVAEGKAPSEDSGLNSSLKSVKDSKVGGKRKHANGSDQPTKKMKVDADKHDSQTNAMVCEVEKDALESELKAQNKAIWDLKDNLKKYVSRQELVLMLEANDQSTSGSELDLRDRCADGMLFGALKRCAMCSGHLSCSGSAYKCHGHISEWSKCSHSTSQSERIEGKWKIPEESDNQFLVKWYKSQAAAKPVRILPPSTSNHTENQLAEGHLKDEKLGNLRVVIAGLPEETVVKTEIERAGGQVHTKIEKGTNCLAVNRAQKLCDQNAELEKARSLKIPIVGDDYLDKCIQYKKKLPFGPYMIEGAEKFSSMVTVKVTGKVKSRSVVREASGRILEDGLSVYNTTLSLCDCKSGTNSYYKLQIIQDMKDDKGNKCYVFRKWGRVGNDNIWSGRIEKMSKSNAIKEFKQLFQKQTGNPWEAWVHKQNFQKLPGKFFPLDIDDGVNKQGPATNNNIGDENSNLAPALQELIKMLFDVETYRAAMLEFGIDPIKMPLGKLSDSNIQKGFEALAQIENILGDKALQPSVKESRIDDASNKFFNLIPSINPHVIRDEDDLKSKVKMLEALKDVEIASRLVGFNLDSNDPLDEKYRKLHCDMVPLPHSSEDYQLIQKYLLSTHGPTHTKWSLELEEVFSLEREGEHDKFAPQREKLGNRMLLWHGSRLINFIRILSQGLRIAPPEAPKMGYMFGKGVYFADLGSKSARYCYPDRKNAVGLMLLSEVALGQVYELKRAEYMEEPPSGKHSTKGLGKMVPDEAGFAKWKDEVVVPCGKVVDSKADTSGSELKYNEYIVYNTAQIKMQFLLKVRFHFKSPED